MQRIPFRRPNLSTIIKAFGAAFFFISWLLAQWFRIRKQQKIEGDLATIEQRIVQTLETVQSKTADLASYITGGDSFAYVGLYHRPDDAGNLSKIYVRHHGAHPLYGITMRINNMDKCDAIRNSGDASAMRAYYESTKDFEIDYLAADIVSVEDVKLNLSNCRRYNVQFYARNGSFVQQLHFSRVGHEANGAWVLATRVLRDDVVIFEDIEPQFPVPAGEGLIWWRTQIF